MDTELGDALRAARKAKGWTLRQAEQQTGVANAHLSQIENGHIARPEADVVVKVASAYGMDVFGALRLAGRGELADLLTGQRCLSLVGVLEDGTWRERAMEAFLSAYAVARHAIGHSRSAMLVALAGALEVAEPLVTQAERERIAQMADQAAEGQGLLAACALRKLVALLREQP